MSLCNDEEIEWDRIKIRLMRKDKATNRSVDIYVYVRLLVIIAQNWYQKMIDVSNVFVRFKRI